MNNDENMFAEVECVENGRNEACEDNKKQSNKGNKMKENHKILGDIEKHLSGSATTNKKGKATLSDQYISEYKTETRKRQRTQRIDDDLRDLTTQANPAILRIIESLVEEIKDLRKTIE